MIIQNSIIRVVKKLVLIIKSEEEFRLFGRRERERGREGREEREKEFCSNGAHRAFGQSLV